jgi:hypothetical protein
MHPAKQPVAQVIGWGQLAGRRVVGGELGGDNGRRLRGCVMKVSVSMWEASAASTWTWGSFKLQCSVGPSPAV